MTLRTTPWSRAGLEPDDWEAAVRAAAGHRIFLSRKGAHGPFLAHCTDGRCDPEVRAADRDGLRAVQLLLADPDLVRRVPA